MSSPPRLLLLSGAPGVDRHRLAASACDAIARSGRAVVQASPDDAQVQAAYQWLWSTLAEGIGPILRDIGINALDSDEVGILPGLIDLACALTACESAEPGGAFVVWDAGSPESALRSVSSLTSAQLLLDRLVTPLTASRARESTAGPLRALETMQARLKAAEGVLTESAVAWWVAAGGYAAVDAERSAVQALAMWQVPVDLAEVVQSVDDQEWLAEVLGRLEQPRAPMRWIEQVDDGGLRLCIRLPHVDRRSLRVGRAGPALVLAVHGWRRSLRLPPALQRCLVQGAAFEDDILTVRLRPDRSAWPARVGSWVAGSWVEGPDAKEVEFDE